jgi:hypothetical protein
MTYPDVPATPEEDEAAEDLALRTEAKLFVAALAEFLESIRDVGCGSPDCPGCAPLRGDVRQCN